MTTVIRTAVPADADFIIESNCAMALETEQKELSREVVSRGVRTLFDRPELGFYLVAVMDEQPVASLMITTEWSDWRNGLFWWVQSVYVEPDFRRQGIYRQMYRYVQTLAEEQGGVCGFRLYVERENRHAQQTYQSLGMSECDYRLYEQLN